MKKDACRNRKNPVLTIGITSYNRVVELARCLYSIQTDHPDLIEVIVSEDQSPERTCIKEVTETYARTVNHMVRIHLNPKNLGFDKNIVYDLEKTGDAVQIKDIMKTMDNRIIIDKERLEEYSNKPIHS